MSQVKVLVVEDDKTSAFTIRKLLSDEGFCICAEVTCGRDAIEKAKELKPDIILMDISIEGDMDGVETTQELNRFSDIPIIYMSGYGDDETVNRAKETAPNAYLLKPFTKRELKISIEMALYKHQADRKLKENELKLSTILSNVPGIIIYMDSELRIRYMNSQAENYLNLVNVTIEGTRLGEILKLCHLDHRPVVDIEQNLFGNALITPAHDPLLLIAPDGNEHVFEPWGSMIPTSNGEIDGYLLVMRNITQQHKAEERVRTMAAALASFEEAVVVTEYNPENLFQASIVYTNKGFHRITGWERFDVIGKTLEDIQICTKENIDFHHMMKLSISKDDAFHGETLCTAKDGKEIISQWSATPVKNKDNKTSHVAYVIRDISHIRRLEENIRQSQKIEAVGRLAGGIAHDFNNLLSVINSYSDLQILKLSDESPAMKYAQQIRNAGKKGADLVSQLMTFSRRDKPNPISLNLGEVCSEIQGMLTRVIREDIELTTEFDDELFKVKADQGQIEQALINLCVNARDAMPNGGSIQITVRNRKLDDTQAQDLNLQRPGYYVLLSVSDTGCGIDAETQKHIFDPFFTTKEIGKGTGLGLSTVYGIMKRLGGVISVDSTIGIGSNFNLWFPATPDSSSSLRKFDEVEEAPEGSEKILVVEDDETFLDCIAGLLSLHGYEVYTATNGADALEQFDNINGSPCMLISDIVLPKMSGREVASRILEKKPEIKIIFMTGYDDQLDTFYDFPGDSIILEKPFPLNTLLLQVREMLDRNDS
jgi:PAS domain S-box-containing protein